MLDLEDIGRPLLSLLRLLVQFIGWAVWEFFLQTLCWGLGWLTFRCVSLGSWPPHAIDQEEAATPLTVFLVCAMGVVVLIGGVFAIRFWLG